MEGQAESSVTPIALVALLVMMGLTWSLPRRFAICPLFAITCLMPMGQDLDVVGMHFHLFRILLMVGLARVVSRGEYARLEWTRLDKLFIGWVVVSIVFGSLSRPSPSTELLMSRLGDAYNAVGCYFFARCVIVDFEDIEISIRALAMLSVPLAALMLVERRTGNNPFAMFGGVPVISAMREGSVRCQGAFRHAILAGTFGATSIPLFVALWVGRPEHRRVAVAGMVAAMVIAYTAASSGAMMALGAAMAGLGMWKWRQYMRLVRRGTVVLLLVLAMVMKAPVWYLFDRISNLTGGGGWHRPYLIDQAVGHFSEWWMFGTTYTAHWAPGGEVIAGDTNMMDITNQFILEGIKGGLLKLVLFVVIIVGCFKIVSRFLREEDPDTGRGFMVWCLGVALFSHCLSFMSVPYFDQIIVIWYWLLAVIIRVGAMPVEEEVEYSGSADAKPEWEPENAVGGEPVAHA